MIHGHIFYKNVLHWCFWKELWTKDIWYPRAPLCMKPSAKIPERIIWGPGNLHSQSLRQILRQSRIRNLWSIRQGPLVTPWRWRNSYTLMFGPLISLTKVYQYLLVLFFPAVSFGIFILTMYCKNCIVSLTNSLQQKKTIIGHMVPLQQILRPTIS